MIGDEKQDRFVEQVRYALDAGVDAVDYTVQVRLAAMRAEAVEAAEKPAGIGRFVFFPAIGLAAAAVVLVALLFVFDRPAPAPIISSAPPLSFIPVEDVDFLASEKELEFIEDLDFYAWLAAQEGEAG